MRPWIGTAAVVLLVAGLMTGTLWAFAIGALLVLVFVALGPT